MRLLSLSLTIGLAWISNAALLEPTDIKRQDASSKLVFAHFMLGIVSPRTSAFDYNDDMQRAKAAGIDAFALNIPDTATDGNTDKQLNYAYESAANNGMKVFMSFDYNFYPTGSEPEVAQRIRNFASRPSQLKVNNKIFVSTFSGDNPGGGKLLNIQALRSAAAGIDLYIVPNFSPYGDRSLSSVADVDGAFSWLAWPSNGYGRAPDNNLNISTTDADALYASFLGSGKAYMAPISPWFFTDYDIYNKNWVFPGDLLWFNRWNEILALAPPFVEIATWNDYGESHYIAPYSSTHYDDGASAWAANMPHDGWLEMALPYIAAYKRGARAPTIIQDKLIYWYRPYPKSPNCEGVDGIETLQDAVFVVAMLTQPGTVTVTSGGYSRSFEAPAGATAYQMDLAVGAQSFSLVRGGLQILSGTGGLIVSNLCLTVNYNAFVGVLK